MLGGFLLVGGAVLWVNNPYYGLSLISPIALMSWYLGFYGGGLAVVVGAGLAVRELLRR